MIFRSFRTARRLNSSLINVNVKVTYQLDIIKSYINSHLYVLNYLIANSVIRPDFKKQSILVSM